MEKEKTLKSQISLAAFITIVFIVSSAIMLLTYSYLTDKAHYEESQEELVKDIKLQCEMLEKNLVANDFIIEEPVDLSVAVDSIAAFFDGRVMVVNSDYRIIKDTAKTNQNSFIVSEKVINIMTGIEKELLIEKKEFIQYIYPVYSEGEIKGIIMVNASTDSIDAISGGAGKKGTLVFVVIMLCCVIFAFVFGRSSVKSIDFINQHMEITREGNFGNRIPVKGFKEFRLLTDNYNYTMAKLADIDSSRQEFVSNVSHELKTPITSMKVLADSLIQNEDADLEMYKEFMTDIAEEIERESEIINDLLTLVKTDKSSAEMNIEEVDINQLLEVIIKRVNPIAASRGIDITYESYRDVVADVDSVKLSLALTNIVENAVKYNVDNGWVKVTLNADNKNFHIKVVDSGVGIPDDCKEQVFERFYRVDKARSRDTGGTGLGLAITRNVILMHKGSIKLYSESGEGTTFTIKIPIKRVES